MNTAVPFSEDFASPVLTARQATLHWQLLGGLGICVVPAMTALFMGHLMFGARYLAISMFSLGIFWHEATSTSISRLLLQRCLR